LLTPSEQGTTHETTTPHKEDNATTTSLQRRHIPPPYAIGVAAEGASRKAETMSDDTAVIFIYIGAICGFLSLFIF
jgi:hypothetical protein